MKHITYPWTDTHTHDDYHIETTMQVCADFSLTEIQQKLKISFLNENRKKRMNLIKLNTSTPNPTHTKKERNENWILITNIRTKQKKK